MWFQANSNQTGKGYQVKVDADVVLRYPVNMGNGVIAAKAQAWLAHSKEDHWKPPTRKADNMTIIVKSAEGQTIPDGCQIAAFNESNMLLGVGTAQNGMCGIPVWGDDPTTEEVDGAITGEELRFRYWNGREEAGLGYRITKGKPEYQTDGILILEAIVKEYVPDEFGIITTYPNPFNSTLQISFSIEGSDKSSLRVFDITGKKVADISLKGLQTGQHQIVWDGSGLSSGIYFLRLDSGAKKTTAKVLLLR